MNGLIAWWAKNSVAANLLMIAIIILGVIGFITLGREVFPSGKINSVSITVSFPGAAPNEVEEQVILRIEEAIADVDNKKEISSTAFEGFGRVTITMREGANFTEFLNEIKSRVDGISTLPDSAFPPVVTRTNFNNQIIWMSLAGDIPERELARLARQYRDEVAALPGGSPLVELQGARQEEVSIEISEEALRRYGLTFDEVARAIRGASINRSSGSIRTDSGDVQLTVRQLADTEEEFNKIIIRRNQDGSYLRVGDVASVVDGFVETNSISKLDGKDNITIVVSSGEDPNVVKTSKVVLDWLEKKQDELPDGVELTLNFDFSVAYKERMALVSSNAAIGLFLVLVVLMLFLRPIVAFWVAVGIAVSFIGSFIFMSMVDISLNMLSLFGLLLVIGIVVDDALIVGESIHRQVERGKKGLDAALIGTQIVIKPVFFAVVTTMMAFIPFLFMSGNVSEFLKHVTWTIVLALVFSLIESFFILPAHLAHMKPTSEKGPIMRFQQRIADSLIWVAENIYRPIITLAVKMRYFTIAVFIGGLFLSFSLLGQGWIHFNFMPEVESPFININITMREGTSFTRTKQVYDKVDAAVTQVRRELTEEFDEDLIDYTSLYARDGFVNAGVTMKESRGRTIKSKEVAERLREKIGDIPDAESIDMSTSFSNNGPKINVGIESESIDSLRAVSQEVQRWLRSVNGVYDVRDRLQSPTDEIQVSLKPGAERFGLTLGEVSRQVAQAYYGQEVQRLPRGGDDIRVMLRLPRQMRENVDSLNTFRIRTADGREVPLATVAEVTYAPSFRRIDRFERKRSTRITAEVIDGIDATPITKEFYSSVVPGLQAQYPEVNFRRRGDDQAQKEFFTELLVLYGMALVAMYMLIAIGFSSYFQPILIMSAIPFAFMGAVYGHLIIGEPMALFSYFGIAAAGGVVINDNLVLVDYINRLRKEGVGAFAALVEAGTTRFRPILLTSVTTFIGLVPILMEDSINAKFLAPMVIALAFGVLFALFVTLLFVPALYGVGVDIARFERGLWTGNPQPGLGEDHGLDEEIPDIDDLDHSPEETRHKPGHRPEPDLHPAE
ncbi:MAG: efflux RND transporter permease subunit [bacterium]